jgi:hypothetical protein
VNGSTGSKVQVALDDKTFTPEVRDALLSSKHWAFAAIGRADIKTVDIIENCGGFRVSVDRSDASKGQMTATERRDTLQKMCSTYSSGVSLLPAGSKTDTGNVWGAALTGRTNVKTTATMDVLDCRKHAPYSFDYVITLDMGIWSPSVRSQLEDDIAEEFANKLLIAMGK